MVNVSGSFNYSAFSCRLIFLREQAGLSQRQTSLKIGWTAASYRDVEASIKRVLLKDAIDPAQFFSVPIEWLAEGDDSRLSEAKKKDVDRYISQKKIFTGLIL